MFDRKIGFELSWMSEAVKINLPVTEGEPDGFKDGILSGDN
jgi:hypothetical protein